ncbi:unnamed protein product [Lathyrus sativus]|nr:unnamed protein product [Lathyrus sativus]
MAARDLKGNGFIGIQAFHRGNTLYFLNIYLPYLLTEKRRMWSEIVEWKGKLRVGEWIIGGDFNSVKHCGERVGSSNRSNRVEMEDFASLIDLMEVVDLPTIGNQFTWFNSDGKAKIMLDHFLVPKGILGSWKLVA